MTWTSPTLPKLLKPNDRITITKDQGAWIGSLLPLGACFGPLLITLVVDKIGKKLSLLLCTLTILGHWVIIVMIDSLQAIYVARFIAGMAVGAVFNLVPVYIAEISPVSMNFRNFWKNIRSWLSWDKYIFRMMFEDWQEHYLPYLYLLVAIFLILWDHLHPFRR